MVEMVVYPGFGLNGSRLHLVEVTGEGGGELLPVRSTEVASGGGVLELEFEVEGSEDGEVVSYWWCMCRKGAVSENL